MNNKGQLIISLRTIILLGVGIFIIGILPVQICIPLTTTCIFFDELFTFQQYLWFALGTFAYFSLWALLIIGVIKLIQTIQKNKWIINLLDFLTSFDERAYNKMKRTVMSR